MDSQSKKPSGQQSSRYEQLQAAYGALMSWATANASPEELLAFWRDQRLLHPAIKDSRKWLELCEGVVDVQPGDAALLDSLFARLPAAIPAQLAAVGQDVRSPKD